MNLYRLTFTSAYTHNISEEIQAEDADKATARAVGIISRYPLVEDELLVFVGPIIPLPKPHHADNK